MQKFTISVDEGSDTESKKAVVDGLNRYNSQFCEPDNFTELNIFLKDKNGKTIGGIVGGTYWKWLDIDRFWIDEKFRKQGLGSKLLKQAEEEAVHRGCVNAHLSTHNFQSLDFYLKHGYKIKCEFEDLPKNHIKYLLYKKLL